jgi:hypothetical protein
MAVIVGLEHRTKISGMSAISICEMHSVESSANGPVFSGRLITHDDNLGQVDEIANPTCEESMSFV